MADLKLVYKATTRDIAEEKLLELGDKWSEKHPVVIEARQRNWEKLSTYFHHTAPIRKRLAKTDLFGCAKCDEKMVITASKLESYNPAIKN